MLMWYSYLDAMVECAFMELNICTSRCGVIMLLPCFVEQCCNQFPVVIFYRGRKSIPYFGIALVLYCSRNCDEERRE